MCTSWMAAGQNGEGRSLTTGGAIRHHFSPQEVLFRHASPHCLGADFLSLKVDPDGLWNCVSDRHTPSPTPHQGPTLLGSYAAHTQMQPRVSAAAAAAALHTRQQQLQLLLLHEAEHG